MNNRMCVVAAAVATTVAFGAAASSASALSLGPAGSVFNAAGNYTPSPSVGQKTFGFSGLLVNCSNETLSGRLNGSASVTAASTFGGCSAVGESVPSTPATVSVPGGLTLTLLDYVKQQNGLYQGRATLGTGPGGLSVAFGACTLTLPPNTTFMRNPYPVGPAPAYLGDYPTGRAGDLRFLLNWPSAQSNAYTGSSGCPANQRGTHTTGAGVGFYYLSQITGLAPTP